MKALSNLLALSRHQKRVMLYAHILLNGIRLALWLLPFGTVRKLLTKASTLWCKLSGNACLRDGPKPVSVKFIMRAVNNAARYTPGGALCLTRALTARLLLEHYGYEPCLHIGVTRDINDRLKAHAWIELQGHVVIGNLTNLERYTSLSTVEKRL